MNLDASSSSMIKCLRSGLNQSVCHRLLLCLRWYRIHLRRLDFLGSCFAIPAPLNTLCILLCGICSPRSSSIRSRVIAHKGCSSRSSNICERSSSDISLAGRPGLHGYGYSPVSSYFLYSALIHLVDTCCCLAILYTDSSPVSISRIIHLIFRRLSFLMHSESVLLFIEGK